MSNPAEVFNRQEHVCPDGYFMYALYKFARIANETAFTSSSVGSLSGLQRFVGRKCCAE